MGFLHSKKLKYAQFILFYISKMKFNVTNKNKVRMVIKYNSPENMTDVTTVYNLCIRKR